MQDHSPSPHGVASKVDSLLRRFGALDYFRDRVREAAQEYIDATAEHERRVKLRREAAAKEGVWSVSVNAALVKKKLEEGCFRFPQAFQGRIKLPPGIKKPLMGLTSRAEFPNRPMEPRCLHERIPRGKWSKRDEREVRNFNKKRTEWDKKKVAYMAGPKKSEGGGQSKLEMEWRAVFELAKKRGFPDDGEDGLEFVFAVEAWLPADLSENNDPPTDGPLPVSKKKNEKTSLSFEYAALAAIYDAHWAGTERIAPWGVVTRRGKVRPASGVPGEWNTPEEPGSYRAASWYWQLVMEAKELDDTNTTIVDSWMPDVEADLANGHAGSLAQLAPPTRKPLVELHGQGQQPIVCGKPVTALSNAYYSVVEALVNAGPDGLDFDAVSTVKGDAPKYLRILTGKQLKDRPTWLPKSDTTHWAKAIRTAGTANRGYAIVYSDSQ